MFYLIFDRFTLINILKTLKKYICNHYEGKQKIVDVHYHVLALLYDIYELLKDEEKNLILNLVVQFAKTKFKKKH